VGPRDAGPPHVRVGHRQALIPTPRSAMVGAFYVGAADMLIGARSEQP